MGGVRKLAEVGLANCKALLDGDLDAAREQALLKSIAEAYSAIEVDGPLLEKVESAVQAVPRGERYSVRVSQAAFEAVLA